MTDILKPMEKPSAVDIALNRELSAEVLSMVPDDLLRSEWGRRNSNRRKKPSGGGPWSHHRPGDPRCRCKTCNTERALARSRGLTLAELREQGGAA